MRAANHGHARAPKPRSSAWRCSPGAHHMNRLKWDDECGETGETNAKPDPSLSGGSIESWNICLSLYTYIYVYTYIYLYIYTYTYTYT